jgi:hypothetical protein
MTVRLSSCEAVITHFSNEVDKSRLNLFWYLSSASALVRY